MATSQVTGTDAPAGKPRSARELDNDFGPFASTTHELTFDKGPQSLRLDMRDRDVVVDIRLNASTVRILHLWNVREDTVVMAQRVVDEFLDQVKVYVDANPDTKYLQKLADKRAVTFGDVEWALEDHIRRRAEERGRVFDSYGLETLFKQMELDIDAFIDGKFEVDVDAEPDKLQRIASIRHEGFDEVHEELQKYIKKGGKKRGLVFSWGEGTYPREMCRMTHNQPTYKVELNNKNRTVEKTVGMGSPPTFGARVPPGGGDSADELKV